MKITVDDLINARNSSEKMTNELNEIYHAMTVNDILDDMFDDFVDDKLGIEGISEKDIEKIIGMLRHRINNYLISLLNDLERKTKNFTWNGD